MGSQCSYTCAVDTVWVVSGQCSYTLRRSKIGVGRHSMGGRCSYACAVDTILRMTQYMCGRHSMGTHYGTCGYTCAVNTVWVVSVVLHVQ